MLLGDGNVADDERYGIQRLRSDLDLSQLSSQRHCEPTTDSARRSNRRFQRYARGQTHRQTGHADHNPPLLYWGRSCYFYPVMYARPFLQDQQNPRTATLVITFISNRTYRQLDRFIHFCTAHQCDQGQA